MAKKYTIAGFLDEYSIIIKITSDRADELGIDIGTVVKVIDEVVTIPDPDDPNKPLGKYTFYKDSLEVTEINDKYLVATKYVTEKTESKSFFQSNPLFSTTSEKKVTRPLSIKDGEMLLHDDDGHLLKIGDEVVFMEE